MARLIDATELIREMNLISHVSGTENICIDCIVDTIDDAPTVDAVPVVHGRWKYYHKQNMAVCTNCSFERDLDTNFGKAVSCPNCGARMDLKEE